MKRSIFTFFLLLTTGILFSQVQKSAKEIQNIDKNNLKNTGPVKPDVNPSQTENNNSNENSDSNIYLKLEYKSEESGNANNEIKSSDVVTAITVEKEETSVKTIDEQIAIQDSYINAINTKISYVKNNPEQHKKAKKSGWYDQMEKNKNEAELKKIELINSKK